MKRRILLVDDDPDVRRSLKATLTKAGYEVVPASDGAEAVLARTLANAGEPRRDTL